MKKGLFLCMVAALIMCSTMVVIAQTITSNSTGNQGGYWYTFWTDGGGSVSMTLGSGGQFGVTWSNCGNFVCGKGWSTGAARTITWSGSSSGAQYVGVYGWMQNPLVEYYIPRSGGTSRGTYSADGTTYTLYTNERVNMPSIEGTRTFTQYFCGGGSGRSVNFGQHLDGWRRLGMSVGSQNYQVVAVEGWGGSSGSANITVGSSSSTSTPVPTPTPTNSYPTPTPTSGSGSNTIVVRARGTAGSEQIRLTVGGSTIATWTLSTSMSNYTASTNSTGGINVQFINDSSGLDVQVDYITVNGSTRQAENQSNNTGVYQNGSCGGSYSEWLHCNGYIGFGDVSSGSNNPTPTPTNSYPTPTPTSGGNGGCTNPSSISVPFTQNGAGEFCWSTANIGNYINSWNLSLLEVNGVNLTNRWVSASSLPPKQNGLYIIHYRCSYSWGHFEAR